MEKSTEPWAKWEPCPEDVATAALERISDEAPMFFGGSRIKSARWTALPFYQSHKLIEAQLEWPESTQRAFLLDGNGHTWWLNGGSGPVHDVNFEESLALTWATAPDYLRFFVYFLRADGLAFVLLESPQEITATDHDDAWFEQNRDKLDFEVAQLWLELEKARSGAAPLKFNGTDDQGRLLFEAAIVYGSLRARSVFAVDPAGEVEMVEDEPIMTTEGLSEPEYPVLEWEPKAPETAEAESESGTVVVEREHPQEMDSQRLLRELLAATAEQEIPGTDKDVTQAVVVTLLEEAIREREGTLLLRHFNTETQADKPIERLASLVLGSAPLVVIESDIPFVEDFVAGLLGAVNPELGKGKVARATAVSGDDAKCDVSYDNPNIKVHLVSFHAYRTLWDAERTAHELAIKDAAVLIGADRLSDVPEPLRRLTDLVLRFPRIDRRLFERIFERVFRVKPSPGWEGAETDWTRYLVPADFHVPRRLGLSADEALAFLKDRVAMRLRLVSADTGPSLADLHGMGEARQIAEDLIADVRAAQTGEIPWTNVDHGMLLIGRPGTGKTTLARAIAKECGIKFVVASAASWQAAGYLDAHLRAMKADFTEARRFAPSMLFIDEIDSIGSREQLSGQGVQYQTEVINALLEQVQGFDASAPVIVIGATNYVEKVDPALRRAGRLDQTVQIPLPNIEGLQRIFEYYLKKYRGDDEVGADVEERQLAELAFGLTGADVEFFVRGASRRARRESRKISQADLLAEVTRRPRRPDSAPRLDPEGMRRVAVHEAGHAVASLLGSLRGAQLSFVTIVPRLDGSLGFVASVPREGEVLTRRSMMEQLETVLAGRAAEEIIYGPADVGLGAGGASETSDLAVATSMATMLVCQTGLGANKALHWTRNPTSAQEAQIGQLLQDAYQSIVSRLHADRWLLEEVARLLVERQEIGGPELRQITEARRAAPPAATPSAVAPPPPAKSKRSRDDDAESPVEEQR
jgi:ATP-dependent Zn protease